MIPMDRREAIILAVGGAATFCITEVASAQPGKPPITGRALGPDGKPVKKLGCTVLGTNNVPALGKYDPASGEFAFADIPNGNSLLVELTFNGEVFRYPVIHRGGTSRIDVLLPLALRGRTVAENAAVTITQAVSAIAGLGFTLKRSIEARTKYFTDKAAFGETMEVLTEAERLIVERELTGVEKDLVVNLTKDTIALWKSLGPG